MQIFLQRSRWVTFRSNTNYRTIWPAITSMDMGICTLICRAVFHIDTDMGVIEHGGGNIPRMGPLKDLNGFLGGDPAQLIVLGDKSKKDPVFRHHTPHRGNGGDAIGVDLFHDFFCQWI